MLNLRVKNRALKKHLEKSWNCETLRKKSFNNANLFSARVKMLFGSR